MFSEYITQISTSMDLKDLHVYCERENIPIVSGKSRLIRIFAGFLWRQGAKQEYGCSYTSDRGLPLFNDIRWVASLP